jgi:Dolichyl-phosphate-mannose-protein mannosyltransferase
MFRFVLFALISLVAWCFWPVMRGDFVIDDYVFIAQSRMVSSPLAAFWMNHFYEPVYFRPIGVALWWVATRVLELNYAAHSAVNLALHSANVLLVALLVRLLTQRVSAALASAALFALLPFSFAATLWPSNRFDLLAVFFLLCVSIACVRFLREGKPQWWFASGVAALAACWSKELAFPVATAIACVALFARSVAWQRRAILFALLGATITFAFLWRHWMLPLPYAAASADVLTALQKGAMAWWFSAAKLFDHATGADSMTQAVVAILLTVVAFALLTNIVFVKHQRSASVSLGLLFAAIVVSFASIVTQWPLAAGFSAMLDGTAFGTVTFARFYYAPAATFTIVAGLVLSRARLARSLCTLVILCACVLALQTRDLSEKFASWTQTEIRPMSIAATRIAEQVANDAASEGCVVVLIGTQKNHPWFRQFADVTVKALTTDPAKTWRCQVLTESTPWIFISPENAPLADIGLPAIALDAQGTPKPDYVWGGVRYRYRAITSDLGKLPSARFFEWNGVQFNEVTEAVRSGTKEVKSHGWGF